MNVSNCIYSEFGWLIESVGFSFNLTVQKSDASWIYNLAKLL